MQDKGKLLLFFALLCIGLCASRERRSLSGIPIQGSWQNELGSVLNITLIYVDGVFHGTYISAVGEASGHYPLVGQVYWDSSAQTALVSWIVSWQNAQMSTASITAWTGQWFAGNTAKQDEIRSTWLMWSAEKLPDSWAATRVSTNVFQRLSHP